MTRNEAKILFHPIEGTGSLTISWSSGPKGDAIEAKKGAGVGFFSDKGDLLCVIFDEVNVAHDHQVLDFEEIRIEISVKNGRVTHSVFTNKGTLIKTRRRSKKITNV